MKEEGSGNGGGPGPAGPSGRGPGPGGGGPLQPSAWLQNCAAAAAEPPAAAAGRCWATLQDGRAGVCVWALDAPAAGGAGAGRGAGARREGPGGTAAADRIRSGGTAEAHEAAAPQREGDAKYVQAVRWAVSGAKYPGVEVPAGTATLVGQVRGEASCVAVSRDGTRLAVGGAPHARGPTGQAVSVHALDAGGPGGAGTDRLRFLAAADVAFRPQAVREVALGADRVVLLVVGTGGMLFFRLGRSAEAEAWRLEKVRVAPKGEPSPPPGLCRPLCVAAAARAGGLLGTAGLDGLIKILVVSLHDDGEGSEPGEGGTYEVLLSQRAPSDRVTALEFAEDAASLAAVCWNGSIAIFQRSPRDPGAWTQTTCLHSADPVPRADCLPPLCAWLRAGDEIAIADSHGLHVYGVGRHWLEPDAAWTPPEALECKGVALVSAGEGPHPAGRGLLCYLTSGQMVMVAA